MKKQYCKPLAVVENFALSQHIASCQNVMVSNLAIREGCDADAKDPVSFPVSDLFYTDLSKHCAVDGSDMYCYINGGGDTYVFTS